MTQEQSKWKTIWKYTNKDCKFLNERLKKRRNQKRCLIDILNNTQAFYIYRIAHTTSWNKMLLHETLGWSVKHEIDSRTDIALHSTHITQGTWLILTILTIGSYNITTKTNQNKARNKPGKTRHSRAARFDRGPRPQGKFFPETFLANFASRDPGYVLWLLCFD